jgi:polysaccharide biosynthesis transport protein
MHKVANIDSSNLPSRGIKPLVSLISHPRWAMLAFLVVFLAGIPVVFSKGKTQYIATSVLQVAPRYMKNVRDDGELDFPSNTQYREFLEQQTRSVLRYDIVREALANMGDRANAWRQPGESERSAVDRLRDSMMVRSIPDTYMIEVSLQTEKKDGLADIVNAVTNAYLERMKSERVFGADVRINTLEAREAELVKTIKGKVDQRTKFALQLGISAFTGKEENPYDQVVAQMRANLSEAHNKRYDAESKLKAFVANGETDINTRSIQEAVLIDPGLANLKSSLYKRRADLLVQLSGLEPKHPAYQEVTQELKHIESEIAAQTATLGNQVKSSLLARYQTTLDQTRRIENDLAGELIEQEKKGASFANFYNQAMTLTQDIDQDRKELETIRDRLNQFAAEHNSFGFVRLVTPALPPEKPFGMGKTKILMVVLLASLLAMLVLPVVIDLTDRRILTVNDAERTLGIPSLGWMVERQDEATRLFGEDLLRRMAGGLIREQERQGTSVFAFSSVKPGAGTTELVMSLAQTLNALGYPTLVVEANAFKNDKRFETTLPGLMQCLQGKASPSDCVVPATNDTPARVKAGNTSHQRHLDRLDRINEATKAWLQDFRFVLVDIPPFLLSADAEILAHNLQQLIIVIESQGISIGELKRAGRQVEKIDPAVVGIVVNRVRPFEGGGYLQEMLLEHISRRKRSDYFSKPAWALAIGIGMAYWKSWTPRKLFTRKA